MLTTLDPDTQLDWKTHTRGTFVQLRQAEDVGFLSANMEKYVALHNAANDELPIKSFIFDNLRYPNQGAYKVHGRPAEAVHPLLTVMFSLVALLMMALSCFNYINISRGFVAKRVREIGVRKVIGGKRIQLILQLW